MQPLDCRSELLRTLHDFCEYGPDFVRLRISNSRNVALDDVLGHALILSFLLMSCEQMGETLTLCCSPGSLPCLASVYSCSALTMHR